MLEKNECWKNGLLRGMNATALRQAAECGAASAGSAAAGSLFPQFRKYCCIVVKEVMGHELPHVSQQSRVASRLRRTS
jgi:hypothetical protein